MKIKKVILLLFLMFLLSACNAEYSLVYENDVFSESLDVISYENEDIDGQSFSSLIDQHYNNINLLVNYKIQPGDMSEEDYEKYNKILINNNDKYGINYNYKFKAEDDYINSSLVYSLFNNFYIDENYIKAENIKNIFASYNNLDKITISFRTDKKVIDINCDEAKDGVYYWYINSDNYSKKKININIDKSINVVENEKKINEILKMLPFVLGGILIVGIFYVLIKFSNSNKK